MRQVKARLVLGLFACLSLASAHNAGHVVLGNGACVNVGSGKPAPMVPEANPNRNTLGPSGDLGRLDLMPDTRGDQYGARFAAEQGGSHVEAAHAPDCR